MAKKELVISGIQATNNLHIGNCIGCINQMINMQKKYQCLLFIADLHALTVKEFDHQHMWENKMNMVLTYISLGVDIKTIFIQSMVQEHTSLGWVLTCLTTLGELNRMTQFKDKSTKFNQNGTEYIPTGLLVYPPLMAADILLYDAKYVPVGIDQKQHVELTRNIAERFNKKYGPTFVLPEPLINDESKKIYDLTDPTKKMSKSANNPKGTLFLLDDPEVGFNKIKTALTDNYNTIKYDYAKQPGISNLIEIYSYLANLPIKDVEKKYAKIVNYGEFKNDLGNLWKDFLIKFQKKFNANKSKLPAIKKQLADNAKKCTIIANKKINDVYKKIGLLGK